MRFHPVQPLLLAALLAVPAGAAAADASVAKRLESRGITFEVDEDDDYKVVYRFSDEGRTQLLYISGRTESVGGFLVREVFSPAARLDKDKVDGKKALELMADSRSRKLGSWEIGGNLLYFVIKLPDSADAATLESAMDIAASVADNMEIQISGDKDAL